MMKTSIEQGYVLLIPLLILQDVTFAISYVTVFFISDDKNSSFFLFGLFVNALIRYSWIRAYAYCAVGQSSPLKITSCPLSVHLAILTVSRRKAGGKMS